MYMQNIPLNSLQSVLQFKSTLQPAKDPALILVLHLGCPVQQILQVSLLLLPRT